MPDPSVSQSVRRRWPRLAAFLNCVLTALGIVLVAGLGLPTWAFWIEIAIGGFWVGWVGVALENYYREGRA